MLQFTDGVRINVNGPIRQLLLPDGLYVVGEGLCIPCADEAEVKEIIKELTGYTEDYRK